MMHPDKKPRRPRPDVVLRSLHKTRCTNLLSLVGDGKRFANNNDLARALDLHDASYISQMTGPNPRRRFTEVTARRFEHRLKLDNGWLDLER
jgi:hypothetical protein